MAALKLEVFRTGQTPTSEVVVTDTSALEEAKLAAYEAGYSAGWEDAAAAAAGDQNRVKADLARNLQALGFSYQEARMHVLRAIEPLLQDMTTRLLPEMARESLAPMVLEMLMPMAEELADAPITLVLNPHARAAVEALIGQATGLPLTVIEEPTLPDSQVYLRFGDTETKVDLGRATAEIAAAVRGFFDLSEQERHYG